MNSRSKVWQIAVLVALVASSTTVLSAEPEGKLSATRYVDPKGFFAIVPPAGWRLQEYPQDARGKVAFLGPDGAELRVLVNVVDFTEIDTLVSRCKDMEARTGLKTNIEKTDFHGRQAVKRSYSAKGTKFVAFDLLIGKADHNLQYGAPHRVYDTYLAVATTSMETYEPSAKSTTDKDLVEHQTAKKIRLARLMIDQGNLDLALAYIKEGLEWTPGHEELLKLKEEAETAKNAHK
jgi:hypothetical protein